MLRCCVIVVYYWSNIESRILMLLITKVTGLQKLGIIYPVVQGEPRACFIANLRNQTNWLQSIE